MKKKIAHSLDHGLLSLFIQALIVVFVVIFTLETMPSMQKYSATFDLLNMSFTVIFVFELLTRMLVYEKPLRYLSSFFGIVDLVSILPALVGFNSKGLRVVRLIRLLKLMRNEKINRATNRLRLALQKVKHELAVFGVVVLLTIFASAVGVYYCEHEAQPEVFSSIPAAIWWALATLTTVGYGDIYPITVLGKLFSSVVILIGVGIVAIPAGLFSSALATLPDDPEPSG